MTTPYRTDHADASIDYFIVHVDTALPTRLPHRPMFCR